MSRGDRFTIVAIGAAGLGLVHVAFEETGGLFGRLSHLPQVVCDQLLVVAAWDFLPVLAIALGVFGFVLLTVKK
jgi:hypothetical protein